MKKNNNSNKYGYVGFGFLLGVWASIGLIYYMGQDMLTAMGIIGGGICFFGFVHFYTQNNKLKEEKPEKDDDGKKSVLEKARIWKE